MKLAQKFAHRAKGGAPPALALLEALWEAIDQLWDHDGPRRYWEI
jgi:hypothetical protein